MILDAAVPPLFREIAPGRTDVFPPSLLLRADQVIQ
jgi:hypothetical protein